MWWCGMRDWGAGAGLKQSDFTILENRKAQSIASFDFESVDMAHPLNEARSAAATRRGGIECWSQPEDLRNHRLIVFFFDLTSMQPEDLTAVLRGERFYR